MPYDAVPGGARRLDRVLASDYLDGLTEHSLAEVRHLREEAEQEEVDLSYLRRLLQGRIDILAAELSRRADGSPTGLVDNLAAILTENGPRTPAHGLGRHSTKEPSRAGEARRYVESLVADPGVSDPAAHTDEQLAADVAKLRAEEESVSARRKQVQAVFDACSAEIIRRYRDGSADPDALLRAAEHPG